MNNPTRRRIVFDVTEDQYQNLSEIFKMQGSRQIFFGYICDDIIEIEKEHRGLLISAIINRYVKLTDFSNTIKEVLHAKAEKFKTVNNKDDKK